MHFFGDKVYYNGYEVDPKFVEGGNIIWMSTSNGEFIIGTKLGRKYFIKRDMHIRYPSSELPDAVNKIYKATSDAIMKKQKSLRGSMAGLDWEKDHIVVEEDNFKDDENRFVTVSAYISDTLPQTYDYSSLSREEFLQLATDATKILCNLHAHNVIHGDLKEKNIVVVRKGGKFIPYLIDFDTSYLSSAIPDGENIGGSDGYQSPEVMIYGEEDNYDNKNRIKTATDIFSLGVVFHRWWTGAFPQVDPECGSAGAAVYLDKFVAVDSKFNVAIGSRGQTLQSLLYWMFAKDPNDRPTAQQVLDVLTDSAEVAVDKVYSIHAAIQIDEPWEEDNIEFDEARIIDEDAVKSIKRIADSRGHKYHITLKDGTEYNKGYEFLIAIGYAHKRSVEVDFDTPWPEHGTTYDGEKMALLGMCGVERLDKKGQHGYKVTYLAKGADGKNIVREVAANNLRIMGVVK